MKSSLFQDEKAQKFLADFEQFLKRHVQKNLRPDSRFRGQKILLDAINYSLFSGGKRFRPLLAFGVAQIFRLKTSSILPWVSSIEMMHTASFIHDDLPAMDNSQKRRGKVTNHRKFGEDIALLAGDCLFIEAFRLIPSNRSDWNFLLYSASGFHGLMGGQALDLKPPKKQNMLYYKNMHSMKTSSLISASMKGVLALVKKKTRVLKRVEKASHLIGQAFQICDDLQDSKEKKTSNSITYMGKQKAIDQLNQISQEALQFLHFQKPSPPLLLKKLIAFNYERSEVRKNAR